MINESRITVWGDIMNSSMWIQHRTRTRKSPGSILHLCSSQGTPSSKCRCPCCKLCCLFPWPNILDWKCTLCKWNLSYNIWGRAGSCRRCHLCISRTAQPHKTRNQEQPLNYSQHQISIRCSISWLGRIEADSSYLCKYHSTRNFQRKLSYIGRNLPHSRRSTPGYHIYYSLAEMNSWT